MPRARARGCGRKEDLMKVLEMILTGEARKVACPHESQNIYVTGEEARQKLVSCTAFADFLRSSRCKRSGCVFLHVNSKGCPFERGEMVVYENFRT